VSGNAAAAGHHGSAAFSFCLFNLPFYTLKAIKAEIAPIVLRAGTVLIPILPKRSLQWL